jgi:methionine-rich copper-binding protein CopC
LNRFNRIRLVLLLTLLVPAGVGPVWAMFHLHVSKSTPAKDQQLTSTPREIRLWFTEKPEAALSTITVQGADSTKFAMGKVHPTDDPLSVAADVKDSLAAGTYVVKWKSAGKDGHAVRGWFTFSIGK